MKEKILKLRDEGKTYQEIVRELGCSKSTVSYHCGDNQREKSSKRRAENRLGIKHEKVRKKCLFCENKVKTSIAIYCSLKCQKDNKSDNIIKKWLRKEIEGHTGKTHKIRRPIRNYLLTKYNNSCTICGWDKLHPIDKKPLVEIDHINGDSSNSFIENLRVLCPNCHSETPTFKSRNLVSSRVRKKDFITE